MGSGLIDFIITLVAVFGTGALFFIGMERAAPDPLMKKIGQITVAVVLGIVLLLAIKGVLFGGGASVASANIVPFAITVIVIFVLLFLLDKILQAAGSWGIPGWILEIVRYVIFAVVLIALLVMLDKTFLGGKYTSSLDFGGSPSIMRPERR